MSRYRFIAAERANHAIALLCRVLEVSRSGYDVWRSRLVSVRRGRKRVARLMRETGPLDRQRRRGVRTTRRDAADLVHRSFVADRPHCLWVADITYVPTGQGTLNQAVVLDVFGRKVVGWAMADSLRNKCVRQSSSSSLITRHS